MMICSFGRATGNDKAEALSLARAVVAQVPSSGRAHFLVVCFAPCANTFNPEAIAYITPATGAM